MSFKNKNIPVFYQNILQFWAEFSQSEPFTASSVLSECIWYNSHITVGDNVIRPSFFSINKAIFVADLFDNDGNVSSWLDFSSKNEISGTKYFNWVQLINALPSRWKNVIKDDRGRSRQFCVFKPHIIYNARILPIDRLSSKELYTIRLSKIVGTPTAQKHIQKLLNVHTLPWKNIYSLIRSTSIDSYSRMFQYKCLNSILFLNLPLFRMGLCSTPLCSFCQSENETISHLFCFCPVAKSLWRDLQQFLPLKSIFLT